VKYFLREIFPEYDGDMKLIDSYSEQFRKEVSDVDSQQIRTLNQLSASSAGRTAIRISKCAIYFIATLLIGESDLSIFIKTEIGSH
jgi:hypothetical protein